MRHVGRFHSSSTCSWSDFEHDPANATYLLYQVKDASSQVGRARHIMPRAQRHGSSSRLWLIPFTVGTVAAATLLLRYWSLKHISVASIVIDGSFINNGSVTCQHSDEAIMAAGGSVDLNWYPPIANPINNLSTVLNSTGFPNAIFDSSITPRNVAYSTYNYCNMPHVRASEYKVPSSDYKLEYVEVIHRHHKRTPYASNTFPVENYPWLCDDQSLYYYGAPSDNSAAQIAWSIGQSLINPFVPTGFPNSTCQFPQITAAGLLDSRQHGADLAGVYRDMLDFLPKGFDPQKIEFHVTNNVITSQVAGEVAVGMYPSLDHKQLKAKVQPTGVDSLEPQYSCPNATAAFSSYGVGSRDAAWRAHLNDSSTVALFAELDAISGINTSSSEWHNWFDHYFDNLSSKLCHQKALPYNNSNSSLHVSEEMTNAVFRRGMYEYSYVYRDSLKSLAASTASYGVWVAELAHNIRAAVNRTSGILWRHNIAHDGSMSRLLSILQVNIMVWPGMGSELVLELWSKQESGGKGWYLRALWKGEIFQSSNPSLGSMDMVQVEVFLQYIDGLVGNNAVKVPQLCKRQ